MASQHEQHELLREAIELARTGDRVRARALLEQVIAQDQYSETAWMWMATVAETNAQRREALEIVLEINPDNETAHRALERLGGARAGRLSQQSAWLADRIGGEAAGERDFQRTAKREPPPPTPPPPVAPTLPPDSEGERAHRLIEMARRGKGTPPPGPTSPEPTTAYYDFAAEARRRRLRTLGDVLGALVVIALIAGIVAVFALVVAPRLPGLLQPPTPPPPTPELATYLAEIATATATPTVPPTGVIVALPAEAASLQPPLWTASPTLLPSLTPRATATPPPPASYALIFSSRREGDAHENVYTARADGSDLLRLSADEVAYRAPVPAPDGSRLAWVQLADDADAQPELVVGVLPLSQGQAGPAPLVVAAPGGQRLSRPSWSPDGLRLAFSSDADGDDDVYLVNADGTGLVNLTANEGIADRDPVWSPDGAAIAFASDRDGPGATEIYRMDTDGTDAVRLTDAAGSSFRPAWSPDGQMIVFVSDRDHDADLYAINAAGSGERLLTRGDGGAEDRDPAWSPDGHWIAFSSNRADSFFQLYLIDPGGGSVRPVTRGAADDRDPAWSSR